MDFLECGKRRPSPKVSAEHQHRWEKQQRNAGENYSLHEYTYKRLEEVKRVQMLELTKT